MKGRMVAGAGWSIVESFAGQIISLVVFFILARLLSPSDFGLMAIANIYILLVQYLIFQGLGQAIIQFENLDAEHLDTVFWINLALAVSLSAATLFLSKLIAHWFNSPELTLILQSLSPIFVFAALSDVQNNLLGRNMEFRSLAIRTLCSYTLGGAVGITLAIYGYGVWSFVAQQLTVWLVNFIALWTASTWRPSFSFSLSKAKRLSSFGINLLGVDILNLASRRADQSIVGHSLGTQSLGFYSLGARVSSLISEVLIKSISRVTMSGLARLQNEREKFSSVFHRILEMQMLITLPIAAGMILLSRPIIQFCFGDKWTPSVPVMQILLLAIPLEALSAVHFSALTAIGKPKFCSLLMFCHAICNVAFCLIAVRFGMIGISSAIVFRALLIYPLELFVMNQIMEISAMRILRLLLPILLATTLMVLAMFGIRRALDFSVGLDITLGVATGLLSYTTAMALLRPKLLAEIWGFRKLLGNKFASA